MDALDTAKSWLTTCLTTHEYCNVDGLNTAVPTRLLSIFEDPPRLVSTAELTTRPRYGTLSHCWGNKEFLKLNSQNIDSLARAIPNNMLSKTFKDAIQITRRLGIAYLWIDSLCIIQNDDNDWEHEASLMSSVYGGSTINIAASTAVDGTEGCFSKPDSYAGEF